MSCFTESEIARVALQVIGKYPGIHTSQLIDEIRGIMNPSGEDCEILHDRNDDKFSQKVRNLKSHNSLKDKVLTEGGMDCRWFLR